jgi:hypothetical protein
MLHKCLEPLRGWFGGYCPFVGDRPLEEDELPAPFVPFTFVDTPLPLVDEARNPDPTEKEDCGKLKLNDIREIMVPFQTIKFQIKQESI